jgi:hypothetical protein
MDAGDGRDRPRGAEEMRSGAVDALAEIVLGLEFLQGLADVGDHILVSIGADISAPVPLGKIDDADRQRGPAGNAVLHLETIIDRPPQRSFQPVEVEPDQLGAAAADIEDKRPIATAIDEGGAS